MNAGTVTEIDEEQRIHLEKLSRDELEDATIEAILQHRRFVAADEIVYQEWQQAAARGTLQSDQIERLKADCLRRRQKTLAHQSTLAFMLDRLGYMPTLPETESQISEDQIRP